MTTRRVSSSGLRRRARAGPVRGRRTDWRPGGTDVYERAGQLAGRALLEAVLQEDRATRHRLAQCDGGVDRAAVRRHRDALALGDAEALGVDRGHLDALARHEEHER